MTDNVMEQLRTAAATAVEQRELKKESARQSARQLAREAAAQRTVAEALAAAEMAGIVEKRFGIDVEVHVNIVENGFGKEYKRGWFEVGPLLVEFDEKDFGPGVFLADVEWADPAAVRRHEIMYAGTKVHDALDLLEAVEAAERTEAAERVQLTKRFRRS